MAIDVRVRPAVAVAADAEAVVAMLRRLARFEDAPAPLRFDVGTFARDVCGVTPRLAILVAELEQRLVGCFTLFPTYSTWEGGPGAQVGDLWVEPAYRASGADPGPSSDPRRAGVTDDIVRGSPGAIGLARLEPTSWRRTMPVDREHLNETDPDSSLPIADIDGSDVAATAAEKVKGGSFDIENKLTIGSATGGAGAGKIEGPSSTSKG